MLIIKLHGGFRARDAEGREISIRSRKAKALLAYLASPLGKVRSRENITALLWSERGDEQARGSLRQALRGLRQDLGEELSQALRTTNDGLALDPDQVTVVEASSDEEFLEGFHINDPAFDEWLRDERVRVDDGDRSERVAMNAQMEPPDKPTIAVMPFVNFSDDPKHKYFADGMTEDIVTALAKTPKLFVIDKKSTLKYKGEDYDPERVSKEQGVRYLLEGSVQMIGDRMRVNAKLIDTDSGHHVWAERYDRLIDDVFALQDEMTHEVILALQVKLTDGERARMFARGMKSFEAWELIYNSVDLLNSHDVDDTIKARSNVERALKIDDQYSMAHAYMGWVHWMETYLGMSDDPGMSLDLAFKEARYALTIDPDNTEAHPLLAACHLLNGDFDLAEEECQIAMKKGPNNSKAFSMAADVARFGGKPEQTIALMKKAIHLSPIYPAWFAGDIAEAYFFLGDLDNAEDMCRTTLSLDPGYIYATVILAGILAMTGRDQEAQEVVKDVLASDPNFTINDHMRSQVYRRAEDPARIIRGMRLAGFPE